MKTFHYFGKNSSGFNGSAQCISSFLGSSLPVCANRTHLDIISKVFIFHEWFFSHVPTYMVTFFTSFSSQWTQFFKVVLAFLHFYCLKLKFRFNSEASKVIISGGFSPELVSSSQPIQFYAFATPQHFLSHNSST